MFEKSLYDLIRGLRANKGNERGYILDSLKECRNEVRSQDMDLKATAILKLIYLDMFGHDMSWASFHALEVMSSPKFRQKRIGYLAAVQSFRMDTDVLMLTTNLIKKDLYSASVPEMSLAINGLSHIVSPSLARDLSPDLVSKLTHSSAQVRKKAVVVLYKCFLQSPELLRTCWPRLRDCLHDEDTSVVSATVNIVCELARRNPKNYLPLAPQLFNLLTDGGNNWMTIKLIKLFATLTPLEPRLIKKLIPPITNLIRTTPAMSLLYESINGLISGGLLAGIQDTSDGEELASVCVMKLRGFLVEGDSNLKYVGLAALTKLTATHAHLVNAHQDVILECVEDADISIRYRALELVVGMVNSESLPSVVGRLMRQLRSATSKTDQGYVELEGGGEQSEDDDMEEEVMNPRQVQKGEIVALELPDDYKRNVIVKIVEMCSREMYANVVDFEWYLDVLVQLVRFSPPVTLKLSAQDDDELDDDDEGLASVKDVGEDIGGELRNVAVRVKAVRPEAVRCAEMLVSRREGMFPAFGGGGRRVLGAACWLVGEYSTLLTSTAGTFDALLQIPNLALPADILAIYIQAVAKVFATINSRDEISWTPERKSGVMLMTDRTIRFLEPLATSPNLEVQERAVEFLELFRLVSQAIENQPASMDDADEQYDPPLLLTQALPALFNGHELNPVAPRAQRKVPLPPDFNLDEPINPNLHSILAAADFDNTTSDDDDDDENFKDYYYVKPKDLVVTKPASLGIDSAAAAKVATGSYQNMAEDEYLDADIVERRKRERRERYKDDPFYIFAPGEAEGVTEDDLDDIPIMKLDLGDESALSPIAATGPSPRRQERAIIAVDENIGAEDDQDMILKDEGAARRKKGKKKGLLQVDASGLVGYSLDDDLEGKDANRKSEEETRAAMEEVERFRREMEAAAQKVVEERSTEKQSMPKKKKKVKAKVMEDVAAGEEKSTKGKKKKKKKASVKDGDEKPRTKKKVKKLVEKSEELGDQSLV